MRVLVLTLSLWLCGCVSIISTFTADDQVSKTLDVNGTKNQLYTRANEWMIAAFNSAESVIEYSDKEDGVIIGKYQLREVPFGGKVARLYATITIRVKDYKARIEVQPYGTWGYYKNSNFMPYTKEIAIQEIQHMVDNFELFIRSGTDF